jgi:hypothetical protein
MLELEEELADELVKETMLAIMTVLYEHGFTEVSIGALMRLLGVEFEHAQAHDDDYLIIQYSITDSFKKSHSSIDLEIPPNTTIH